MDTGKRNLFRRSLYSTMTGASVLALATASATFAAEDKKDNEEWMPEEIVVTASRREETLQDVGMSVSVVKPDAFAVSGLVSLREVLEYTPGVTYGGGASPTDNAISIRGVSTTVASPTVSFYIDDVPIGSRGSFSRGAGQALDALQSSIERVEIVKGPQGTLYGGSAMGGLIKYVTKRAYKDEVVGSVSADISQIKEGGLSQRYSAGLSVPVIEDKLGVFVSGYYNDSEGFIDRDASSSTGAAEDVNGNESYGLTLKIDASLSDDFEASLLYLKTNSKINGTNRISVSTPEEEPIFGAYVTEIGGLEGVGDFNLYAGTFRYALDFGTLISSTSYEDRSINLVADRTFDLGGLLDALSGNPPGTVTSSPFVDATLNDKFVQELRLQSNENDKFEWVVGGIYSKETGGTQQALTGLPVNFVLLDVFIKTSLKEYAAFGDIKYYVNENFDISIGARISKVDASLETIEEGSGIIVRSSPEITNSATTDTYSLSARYRPNEDISLFARIASGYRPSSPATPIGDLPPIVETDTLWSYEAGVKGQAMESRLRYELVAWYLNWDNLQAVVFDGAASSIANADVSVTASGLESSLFYTVNDSLNFFVSGAYTKSTLDDDEVTAFGALKGENMVGIPKWSAAFKANFRRPITDTVEGFMTVGVRYVGERDSGFEGGVGADGSVIVPFLANIPLDGYIQADLSAGVELGSVTISAYVKNMFNKYAFTAGSQSRLQPRATVSVLEPRTAGVRVKFNY
ncbi:MAG: TonB-dependent receptor [Kordiimonadaceae bacterium]|nr:TonB-dependent receptor [Kordiimonadaceae bacterium]